MNSTNIPGTTASLARDHSSSKVTTSNTLPPTINTTPNWQHEYKASFTSIEQLCQHLELSIEHLPISIKAHQNFQLRVPHSYVARMQKSNPYDPLLLQVLPTNNEDQSTEGFSRDPVGDLQSIKAPGLLQKYNGRALLLATSRCAIHCRYCFRRHFPYSSQNPRHDDWNQALQELQEDSSITEIILSGGDPLVLDDSELSKLIDKLESIEHIQKLRIHTRLPVVIPKRINHDLLDLIKSSRLQVIMVLHINHAQEINNELYQKLASLKNMNCTLLNQSVLLRNINDQASSLVQLSNALFNAGVLPYYLHLLDKVDGAAHFDVSEERARILMREVSRQLPGYLTPKLVKEIPGEQSKKLVSY